MKFINYFLIATGFFITSCGSDNSENIESNATEQESQSVNTDSQPTIAQDVPAEEFKSFIENGHYELIDVRTPEEFEAGTIGDAQNINFLGDDFKNEISRLDHSKPILVFCQAGGRSSKAMKQLTESGFTEVYNLIGGYGQWPK